MLPFTLHVRTLTGLEPLLAEELAALGAVEVQPRNRVVTCQGDLEVIYRANLWCRTAIRVLRKVGEFAAGDEKALYQGIHAIDWSPWMSATGTLAIDGHVYSSFTTHSLFVAQLSKDAVVDQFRDKTGERPSVDLERPDLRIAVTIFKNEAQVFVDTSGESLHRRGYRLKAGEAPLSEVLAAGIVKLSGWVPATPLVDPMCGSGTFGIEAGLILKNVAPGLFREEFGFQKWKDYDPVLFEKLVAEAKQAIRKDVKGTILGIELDRNVAAIARENVERAGLRGLVQIEAADFFQFDRVPAVPGTVVINPPYDERLAVDNIAELYQRIGNRLKEKYRGWTAHLLSGNAEAVKHVGLKSSRKLELFNGAIECELVSYPVATDAQVSEPQTNNPEWTKKAEVFANRLRKNLKHYSKWAKREGITCWRVYDWDIPEFPFILDLFGDKLHFAEVPRNLDRSPLDHQSYMQLMVKTAAQVLGLSSENLYFKKRKPQKSGSFKNTSETETGEFLEVGEGGHRFLVNLADYLDVGLFLEHRKARAWIQKDASGKDFLNLYGYTGALTVYAAAGGAKSTTTVDTASTYLEWAGKNLALNGQSPAKHHLVRADVLEYLEGTSGKFDLIAVDPPAKSVNRKSGATFDVQADHVRLLRLTLDHLRPGGKILFSTNYRNFKLDEKALAEGRTFTLKEISVKVLAFDFERKPSHRTWLIELPV